MKKNLKEWIIALTLGLLLGMTSMSAVAEEYTFRRTAWGMSKEQVKEAEKEIAYESETILGYEGGILEFDCRIGYIFTGGKLVRAKYIVEEEHSNDNQYITDYKTLRTALSKKYGEPLESNRIWLNDLYEDDPQRWGFAVSIGHMRDHTRWETPQTIIFLALQGDNYEILLAIEYTSKELRELEQKEKEKQSLDVL